MKSELRQSNVLHRARFSRQILSRERKSVFYCGRALSPRVFCGCYSREYSERHILCSNQQGTRWLHIQVKTVCSRKQNLQRRNESDEERRTYVLFGVGRHSSRRIDSTVRILRDPIRRMAKNVSEAHELWLSTPGKTGQAHKDNKVRTVHLPPYKSFSGWDISTYRDRWDLIEAVLSPEQSNASEM